MECAESYQHPYQSSENFTALKLAQRIVEKNKGYDSEIRAVVILFRYIFGFLYICRICAFNLCCTIWSAGVVRHNFVSDLVR